MGEATMTVALVVLAAVSALRGTWSPCGLSMASTITPIAERARHRRYSRSAAWFVAGSAVGGATLGAGMGLGSWLCHRVGAGGTVTTVIAILTTVICLAADARLWGFHLPEHPRQVDATWVGRYRPWVYAGGFGWQLGTGVSTYLMTNATYAVIVVGIVALPPAGALLLGMVYGLCRGTTILLGAAVTSPDRLLAVHRWLAASDRASLTVTMLAQIAFAAVCAARVGEGAVIALGGAALLAILVARVDRVRSLIVRTQVGVG